MRVNRSAAGLGLLAAGYAVALAVITRLVPVLRQRRRRWFLALEAATGCVAAGWGLRGRTTPMVLNATAVVGLAVAWWATGRRAGENPLSRRRPGR